MLAIGLGVFLGLTFAGCQELQKAANRMAAQQQEQAEKCEAKGGFALWDSARTRVESCTFPCDRRSDFKIETVEKIR